MPALSFRKRYREMILEGLRELQRAPYGGASKRAKRQTVRAYRRDGRDPRVGAFYSLYCGMRTKSCERLGQVVVRGVMPIRVSATGAIRVAGVALRPTEAGLFAYHDGFESLTEFVETIREMHGLPFRGLVILW